MPINKRELNFLLFGVLVALSIFGLNTPFLPHFRINYTVPGSWPEYLTAIGTLGAVIISLFGESLKKWIRPSKVEIVDKSCLIQTGTGDLGVSRLRLRNTGSGVARNVCVYVDTIYNELTCERKNFLPVPLRWTHDGNCQRDLMEGQYWHIDLVEVNRTSNKYYAYLVLFAGGGIDQYQKIEVGKTILKLVVYHSLGSKIYEVKIEWNPNKGDKYVSISNFKEKKH